MLVKEIPPYWLKFLWKFLILFIYQWNSGSSNVLVHSNSNMGLQNIKAHCIKSVLIRSYSGPYFPAYELYMEYLFLFSPNAGKYVPEYYWIPTFHAVTLFISRFFLNALPVLTSGLFYYSKLFRRCYTIFKLHHFTTFNISILDSPDFFGKDFLFCFPAFTSFFINFNRPFLKHNCLTRLLLLMFPLLKFLLIRGIVGFFLKMGIKFSKM